MTRSIWKAPYIKNIVFKELYTRIKNNTKTKPIIVKNKGFVIYPIFIGYTFSIYNGKTFTNILINEKMVGYKFGEFVFTRKKALHNKK